MPYEMEAGLTFGLSAAGLALFLWALPFSLGARRQKPLGCPTCHAGWMAIIVTQVFGAWADPAWSPLAVRGMLGIPFHGGPVLLCAVLVGMYVMWVLQRSSREGSVAALTGLVALLSFVVGLRVFWLRAPVEALVVQQLAVWAVAAVVYKLGAVLELPPDSDPLPEGLLEDDAPNSGEPTDRAGS